MARRIRGYHRNCYYTPTTACSGTVRYEKRPNDDNSTSSSSFSVPFFHICLSFNGHPTFFFLFRRPPLPVARVTHTQNERTQRFSAFFLLQSGSSLPELPGGNRGGRRGSGDPLLGPPSSPVGAGSDFNAPRAAAAAGTKKKLWEK